MKAQTGCEGAQRRRGGAQVREMYMRADGLLRELKEYGADTNGAIGRFLGDEELFATCLDMFMDDEAFDVVEKALAERNWSRAVDAAHKLKGVSGNLGLTPVYEPMCAIVALLREAVKDEARINAEHGRICAQMERLRGVVRECGSTACK